MMKSIFAGFFLALLFHGVGATEEILRDGAVYSIPAASVKVNTLILDREKLLSITGVFNIFLPCCSCPLFQSRQFLSILFWPRFFEE